MNAAQLEFPGFAPTLGHPQAHYGEPLPADAVPIAQARNNKPEEIIGKLREAEIVLAQGGTVADACRRIGVTEQSYYRWRKEYGGLKMDQARRMKELERENARLKRLVADLSLDKAILTEATRGNF
jgi:hypothetical protein